MDVIFHVEDYEQDFACRSVGDMLSDLLMACSTGAVRKWLKENEAEIKKYADLTMRRVLKEFRSGILHQFAGVCVSDMARMAIEIQCARNDGAFVLSDGQVVVAEPTQCQRFGFGICNKRIIRAKARGMEGCAMAQARSILVGSGLYDHRFTMRKVANASSEEIGNMISGSYISRNCPVLEAEYGFQPARGALQCWPNKEQLGDILEHSEEYAFAEIILRKANG